MVPGAAATARGSGGFGSEEEGFFCLELCLYSKVFGGVGLGGRGGCEGTLQEGQTCTILIYPSMP